MLWASSPRLAVNANQFEITQISCISIHALYLPVEYVLVRVCVCVCVCVCVRVCVRACVRGDSVV